MQPTAISALLQSKKFLAAALAALLSTAGLYKGLTLEQIGIVTAPLYAFIAGQAVADFGKERAKVDATKPKPPSSPTPQP